MEAQLGLLKQFLACVKANPSMMNKKELSFFKEFIESYGGTVPADPEPAPKPTAEPKTEEKKEEHEEKMEEDEVHIPYPILSDLDKVVQPDTDEFPMGDFKKEMGDEEQDSFTSEKNEAIGAMGEGEYEKAMGHFTKAIEINPQASMIYAKRAQCLIQMKKPAAAIRDASRAIELNADSANAYKWRGKGHRLLGHWVEAHADFATALKIDYDDSVNEWMKEVEPNAMKLKEYNRALERQKEEKELNERRERVKRAKEENAKAAQRQREEEEAMGGMGGEGMGMGGMGDFLGNLLKDPELKEAMQDPQVASAVMELMQDPSAIMKHMGNQKVMAVFAKLKGMFGGMGGMGEEDEEGGHHHHEEGGCCGGHEASPPKAPEGPAPKGPSMPDLD